jgi:F-type H+-transporting ATPase subunit b
MGFDLWSFVFQTINFVVLVLVLTRLVYRPLRRSIDERNAKIVEREAATRARSADADTKMKEAGTKEREMLEERDALLRVAREEAAELRTRLVAQAEEDAAAARQRGERLLEMERETARERVAELAVEKSVALASAILAGLSHEALDGALLTMLLAELHAKLGGEAASATRAMHAAPHAFELTFARAPRPDAVAHARAVLSEIFGAPVEIACGEDPSLVAGVLLRFKHEVWDASVAGQLTAFRDRARRELDEQESSGA